MGLLGSAALRLALQVHWDWVHLALMVAAFAALRREVDVIWVMAVGAAISVLAF